MSRFERTKELVEQLKGIAKELDVAIITVQQPRPMRSYTVADHIEAMRRPIFIDHASFIHDALEREKDR